MLLHTCTQLITAALFVIAEAKGNPVSINMLIKIYMMEYYSAIKKNTTIWMNLKIILLSKSS